MQVILYRCNPFSFSFRKICNRSISVLRATCILVIAWLLKLNSAVNWLRETGSVYRKNRKKKTKEIPEKITINLFDEWSHFRLYAKRKLHESYVTNNGEVRETRNMAVNNRIGLSWLERLRRSKVEGRRSDRRRSNDIHSWNWKKGPPF